MARAHETNVTPRTSQGRRAQKPAIQPIRRGMTLASSSRSVRIESARLLAEMREADFSSEGRSYKANGNCEPEGKAQRRLRQLPNSEQAARSAVPFVPFPTACSHRPFAGLSDTRRFGVVSVVAAAAIARQAQETR